MNSPFESIQESVRNERVCLRRGAFNPQTPLSTQTRIVTSKTLTLAGKLPAPSSCLLTSKSLIFQCFHTDEKTFQCFHTDEKTEKLSSKESFFSVF